MEKLRSRKQAKWKSPRCCLPFYPWKKADKSMSEIPSRKMTRGVTVLALTTGPQAPGCRSVCLHPQGHRCMLSSPFMVSPEQSACRVGRSSAISHDSVTRAEMREDSGLLGRCWRWWRCGGLGGGSIRCHHWMCREIFSRSGLAALWVSEPPECFSTLCSPLPEYLLSYLLW